MTLAYTLEGVGMRYGEAQVLGGISLRLAAPSLVAVVGPNGAGKSTMLGIMAGLRDGYTGRCELGGVETGRWKRKALAREVAFVPQSLRLEFPFTAEQVVLMGRTPYAGGMFESGEDWAAVRRAMEQTDTLRFARRDFRSLSGGERQRVVLASALAQTPRVLLLDEPTTFLDLQHQISIYALLQRLAAGGLLVVTVTHDLNLAAAYADRVIALRDGRLAADGPPAEALSPAQIAAVFGVVAGLLPAGGGRHWITYGP
jgi:iron complex transport system ATP-binding protein